MKPPIFINYNGDLCVFSTLEKAQDYLEPEDVDSVNIYDAHGFKLQSQIVPHSSNTLAGKLGLTGRKILITEFASHESLASELVVILRRFLIAHKFCLEEISNANLEQLVQMSLAYKTE